MIALVPLTIVHEEMNEDEEIYYCSGRPLAQTVTKSDALKMGAREEDLFCLPCTEKENPHR